MMAADSMVVPTAPFNLPSSLSVSTVMPTLVAARMMPMKIASRRTAESAAAELQLPQRGFPACFGVFHPQPEGAGYFRPAQNRQDGRVAGIVFQESGQAVGPVLALLQGRHVNDRIDIAVEHSVECPGLPLDFIAG